MAVVGLLLAALYNLVWTSGIKSSKNFAQAMTACLALYTWNLTPWIVVVLCALAAGGLAMLPQLLA